MKYYLGIITIGFALLLGGCNEEEAKVDAAPEAAISQIDVQEGALEESFDLKIVSQGRDLPKAPQAYEESLTIRASTGEDIDYRLALALTPKEQSKGMMNRNFMPTDFGMLFVFEEPYVHGFWMKNVLVPLDMLFIADDGRIHHIHAMAEPLALDSIRANDPSRAVLEIAGGQAAERGIKVGDYVMHDAFKAPQAPVANEPEAAQDPAQE